MGRAGYATRAHERQDEAVHGRPCVQFPPAYRRELWTKDPHGGPYRKVRKLQWDNRRGQKGEDGLASQGACRHAGPRP